MPNPHNEAYLRAKRDRLGHTLHHQGLALDEEMLHDEHEHDRRRRESQRMSEPAAAVGRVALCVARFYTELAEQARGRRPCRAGTRPA